MARLPLHPTHPWRTCWGCDKYCPAEDLACGNGTIRTPHPAELFGDDWDDWVVASAHDGTGGGRARPDPALPPRHR